MRFIRDASIRIKVLIPPAILILALGLVSLLAIFGTNRQRAVLAEVHNIALDKITLIDEFIVLSERVQSDVFRIAVIRFANLPEEEIQPTHERLEQGLNDLDVIYGQILTKWSLDETEQSVLERMKEPMDAFRQQALQAAAVVADNPSFGVLLVRSSTVPFAEFRGTLTELRDYQQAKIIRIETESHERARTASTAIIGITFLIALIGVAATVLISTRWISRPVLSMAALMRRLAEGDLSIETRDVRRRDEIGAMARAVEIFRSNAIEKAQAEEALRESEEKFRLIAESSIDTIYQLDLEGNIVFMNTAGARMYGYEAEEMKGLNFRSLLTEERLSEGEEYVRQVLSGQGVRGEMYVKHKEGHEFPIYLSMASVEKEGEIVGFSGASRDITERKRAEEALKEYSERLEGMVEERTKELREAQEQLIRREKLAVLGQLAGGVSHELRGPLGAITTAAYFLDNAMEGPDPEVKRMLAIIMRQVRTSERIIRSLLDFARTKVPVRQAMDVNAVVQEALSRTAVPENVEVVSQLDEELPTIPADPDQLGHAFGNIILNAVQAMPDGGHLVVETALRAEWVAVSFTDTGVGISKENLGKLFEPLFTTKAQGIGLGLAVTRTLVEEHGGAIEVQSEEGQGSTFTVRLPIAFERVLSPSA